MAADLQSAVKALKAPHKAIDPYVEKVMIGTMMAEIPSMRKIQSES